MALHAPHGRDHGAPAGLAGFVVQARDGPIGRIDPATYAARVTCLVVRARRGIFGRARHVVPLGLIVGVDTRRRRVHLACDRARVKAAPLLVAE